MPRRLPDEHRLSADDAPPGESIPPVLSPAEAGGIADPLLEAFVRGIEDGANYGDEHPEWREAIKGFLLHPSTEHAAGILDGVIGGLGHSLEEAEVMVDVARVMVDAFGEAVAQRRAAREAAAPAPPPWRAE